MSRDDGSISTDAGSDTRVARATGPGDWGAGDYPPGIAQETYLDIALVAGQQGLTRGYKVHVPPGYDKNVPMPLLFCIHGLDQTAVSFCVNGSSMPQKSDSAGFLLVMPNGYQNSWNGGTCCGAAMNMGLDDVALIRAILREVGTHVNVDLDRVYSTGLSNGGYLSFRLACEAADVFTATAPGSAALGIAATACNPTRPISVLEIHGTADQLVPYAGQKPALERLATVNGCALATTPAEIPRSGGDTTCVTYPGCRAGVQVTGCTIANGGHDWFGDPGCGTGAGFIGCAVVGANSNFIVNTDAVWSFLSQFRR